MSPATRPPSPPGSSRPGGSRRPPVARQQYVAFRRLEREVQVTTDEELCYWVRRVVEQPGGWETLEGRVVSEKIAKECYQRFLPPSRVRDGESAQAFLVETAWSFLVTETDSFLAASKPSWALVAVVARRKLATFYEKAVGKQLATQPFIPGMEAGPVNAVPSGRLEVFNPEDMGPAVNTYIDVLTRYGLARGYAVEGTRMILEITATTSRRSYLKSRSFFTLATATYAVTAAQKRAWWSLTVGSKNHAELSLLLAINRLGRWDKKLVSPSRGRAEAWRSKQLRVLNYENAPGTPLFTVRQLQDLGRGGIK